MQKRFITGELLIEEPVIPIDEKLTLQDIENLQSRMRHEETHNTNFVSEGTLKDTSW
jgi:hypothetical protein